MDEIHSCFPVRCSGCRRRGWNRLSWILNLRGPRGSRLPTITVCLRTVVDLVEHKTNKGVSVQTDVFLVRYSLTQGGDLTFQCTVQILKDRGMGDVFRKFDLCFTRIKRYFNFHGVNSNQGFLEDVFRLHHPSSSLLSCSEPQQVRRFWIQTRLRYSVLCTNVWIYNLSFTVLILINI